MFKAYYQLAKPGIVYGNVFTTLAAFLFASRWSFSWVLFFATVFGIGLVIASACVFNNYLDRDIDAKMARTKERALATGKISVVAALAYGTLLGFIGFALLYLFVNVLTADIAVFGFVMYVIVYGAAKRVGSWGALVGSISGAVPIVVGYTAVTDHLGLAAFFLFLILVLWQMPHFYAIALYRLNEYKAAGIPVLPSVRSVKWTKLSSVGYIMLFVVATSLMTFSGFTGYVYLVVVLAFGLAWVSIGTRWLIIPSTDRQARKLFRFSLIVLVAFCVALALSPLLP